MAKDARPDRIARLAAALLDAPMAALCVAEEDDLRLAASVGADTPAIERGLVSWARRAIRDGLQVHPDLRDHPVQGTSQGDLIPAGTGPTFRFVAAIPLRGPDGEGMGALCVADRLPRPDLGPHGRLVLDDLAALAVEGMAPAADEDVTRERAAREAAELKAAEAAQRLEQEQRTRARFLSAANHDLRQPFQALHLFLHLLQGKLTEPGQRDLADRIEQAVRNGEAMLTALLDLSALEMGRVRVSVARFRLADVLERLVEDFEPSTQAKGLRLRFVPTELEVETDATLLERVLRHLLANAVRHTRSGSVLIGVRRRGDRAAVEVWDTGPGIAPADQKRIFEPFEQVTDPQIDRSGRLGLGLAIVERTARLLDLGVELRSEPGRGSRFRVLVPRVVAEPAAEEPAPDAGSPVVVIEDDPVQLMAVRMILEGWGLQVVAAPTRERALSALEDTGARPGLVLSDLRLRGTENGIDAVAALRDATGPVPAILMTGDTGPEQVRAAQAADIHLLQKPFGPEHLRGAIERVTGWHLAAG